MVYLVANTASLLLLPPVKLIIEFYRPGYIPTPHHILANRGIRAGLRGPPRWVSDLELASRLSRRNRQIRGRKRWSYWSKEGERNLEVGVDVLKPREKRGEGDSKKGGERKEEKFLKKRNE